MKTNLVLVGMTGSGKTSIGKQLSRKLNLPFRDMDLFIEQKTARSIPELFEVSEAYFRSIEAKVCREIALTESHTVISCGGGVVLNPENIKVLKKTGWIVFIDRPVEHILRDIEVEHRPLLKEDPSKLYQLYDERFELYCSAADFRVENQTTLDNVLIEIQAHLPETIMSKGEYEK